MRIDSALIFFIFFVALTGMTLMPSQAWAASLSLASCSGMPPYQVVTSVVVCVQNSIQAASGTIYGYIASWMSPIVGGMFTISVVMMGLRIAGGEQGAIRHAAPLAIKLAMIWGYAAFIGSIGALAFNTMALLATAGGGGSTPWGMVDGTIQALFGYGPSTKLFQGFLGLIIASLFSGTIGVAVFLSGVAAIVSILSCIGRVIFIYLGAFLVVGFMVAISPMFIPMLVFNVTDRYFKQWLNITIAAMLQPMFLFAVCAMFIGIFPSMLMNILVVTGGNDFRAIWRWNKPLMSWVVPSDPKMQDTIDKQPDSEQRKRPAAVQSYMNPLLADAPNLGMYKVPAIDFGLVHVSKMQQLLLAFVALALFSMLIRTLVEITPQIAEDITASAIGLGSMKTAIESSAGKVISSAKNNLGNESSKPPLFQNGDPFQKAGANNKPGGGSSTPRNAPKGGGNV